MAGGAGEAERGEFVREVAVLACLEVGGGGAVVVVVVGAML